MKVVELFEQIKNTPGTNNKKELLKNNLNDLVVSIFTDTYSDRNYYVKKYNITHTGNKTIEDNYNEFSELLNILSNRWKTGKNAILAVEGLVNQFKKEDQEILKGILAKKLVIGISRDNFLSVCGNNDDNTPIKKFLVSLAFNLDKVNNVNPIDGTFLASRKLDGVRTICFCTKEENGSISVDFKSRKGKSFTTLNNIKKMAGIFAEKSNLFTKTNTIVLDGECCILDENGDEHFDWIMQEVTKKDHTIENPCYNLFDILTIEEFEMLSKSEIFSKRYDLLKSTFNETIKDYNDNTIRILTQERIENQSDFDRWEEMAKVRDWEGFMLRKDRPYENDRTKDLIKVKKFIDAEYVVEGVETGKVTYNEGGNKEYDVVTSLVIKHKGNIVNVGSGLSKEQRISWYNNPNLIIGKTITVKYFEETKNKKDDSLSLRFPVLKYVYEGERTT